jgi:hypothetical protein
MRTTYHTKASVILKLKQNLDRGFRSKVITRKPERVKGEFYQYTGLS